MSNSVTHFAQAGQPAIAGRVRLLVDRYWGGSVNAAANDMTVPQQTLNRIVSGKTKNPRTGVVVQIATACDVSPDWLLTGNGTGPAADSGRRTRLTGGLIRLRLAIDALGIVGALRQDLYYLAHTPMQAQMALNNSLQERDGIAASDIVSAAVDRFAHALAVGLEVATVKYGKARVHRALVKMHMSLALGFTWFSDNAIEAAGTQSAFARYVAFWDAEDIRRVRHVAAVAARRTMKQKRKK